MITKCKDLMLDQFIECICENNLSVLGGESEEERKEAWREIRMEYAALTEDETTIRIELLETEIMYWALEVETVEAAVQVLRRWRMENLIQLLHDKGYEFDYSEENETSYQRDLDRVLKRLRSIKTEQANRVHELNQFQSEVTGDPVNRLDMLHNIVTFSQFMQYNIDEKTTSVEKYVSIRNMYFKKLEVLNNKK